MKYKNRLAGRIAEKEEFEQKQQKLRMKYNIKEDGIIQVRKKRITEIVIKNTVSLIRTILMILEISLSAVALICLLYPSTRLAMYDLFWDLYDQAIQLIGT